MNNVRNLAWLWLAGCGSSSGNGDDSVHDSHDSHSDDSGSGGGDDTGTGGGDDTGGSTGACGDESVPGFTTTSDPTCENTIATGKLSVELEWEMTGFKELSSSNIVLTPPIVASLTDDNSDGVIDERDVPDILLTTIDPNSWGPTLLRAVSGDGAGELWTVAPAYFYAYATPAAADIDGDGVVEILVVTADYRLHAYENDGTEKWTSDQVPSVTHFS